MRNPAGNTFGARVATALYPYAAPTPRPIKVNMFGLAFWNDCHMRSKKGHPHQNTTGVASTSPIQFTVDAPSRWLTAASVSMAPIVTRTTGAPRTTPIQKRRVMSTSSGSGLSVRSGTRGSSAMPQIGQAPGPGRTISGCMGQVYSIEVRGAGCEVRGAGCEVRAAACEVGFCRPPMLTIGACDIGSRGPDRYFAGSAANFARQPFEQK